MFALQRVQWRAGAAAQDDVVAVAAAGGIVVAALANGGLLRWRSDGSSAAEVVEVPKTKKDDRVSHLALDGTGSHAVLSLASGEHWYVHASVAKARKLVKWQGAVVSSVVFHTQSTPTTTKALLVATVKGHVFETVLDVSGKDRAFTLVWKTEQPIAALFAQSSDAEVLSVLVCTAPPSAKVYHFRGAASFEAVFAPSKAAAPRGVVVPVAVAKFCCAARWDAGCGWSVAVTSGSGVLVAAVAVGAQEPLAALQRAAAAPTAGLRDAVAVAATPLHVLVLCRDRAVALSALTGLVVQDLAVDDASAASATRGALGLCRDERRGVGWVWSAQGLWRLAHPTEDVDAWKTYLERAVVTADDALFVSALQRCRDAPSRGLVHHAHARSLLARGGAVEAAAHFAAQDVSSFEEVSLELLGRAEPKALAAFVGETAKRLGAQDKTQQTMLQSWLTELYLRDSLLSPAPAAPSGSAPPLRAQLHSMRHALHHGATYELLASHGADADALFFAQEAQDAAVVVSSHVRCRNWDGALDVLRKAAVEHVEVMLYDTSLDLLQHRPEETLRLWRTKGDRLQPLLLLPALLRLAARGGAAKGAAKPSEDASGQSAKASKVHAQVLDFLQAQDSTESHSLRNYVLDLHCDGSTDDAEAALVRYLASTGDKMSTFDLQFALRTCHRTKRHRACVWLYARLGMLDDAVAAALRLGDVALAKECANLGAPQDVKKRLWLSVAQHVVEDRSLATAEAAGILDECALLSIEDILPFFPDFAVIDAFKSEICRSLQGYNVAVSALKAETDDALAAAADLRGKMQRLGAATAALPADTRCALSGKRVVTGPFYVFSSGYAYLAEALLAHARPHLGEAQRRRVDDVVQALESGGGTEAHALLQAELDSLIAGECPLTGALMIDSVDKPLRASGTDDWAI